jgi:hypothetical protein
VGNGEGEGERLYSRRRKMGKRGRNDLKIGLGTAQLKCVRTHSCLAHVVQTGSAFKLTG